MYFTSGSTEAFDELLEEYLEPCDHDKVLETVQQTTASKLPSTNSLMTISRSLKKSNHEVSFALKDPNLKVRQIVAFIKADNPDLEICYSDELEDNPLIHKTAKPLWVLSKSENGVFKLSRNK
nr:MAG TPA: hypothetical protein [Bacteriophage sp.]